jgi:uncharacterized protein YndB with AHSA1/START domain
MLKTVLIIIALAIVALLAYAATRPDSFRLERQATIKAPPEKIYANLVDFNKWGAWSPWEKLDPQMKRTHSGAASGKGAAYAWAGDKVGAGSMEILEATPSSSVKIKLDFTKPFEAHNMVDFTLVPQGDSTQVTWAMYGPMAFINKLFGVFMSMDKMVGKDFEAGLGDLKAVSEK